MIDTADISAFLAGHRIVVVGASDDRKKFGNTVFRAFRDHGYETVAVNPNAATVEGTTCYSSLTGVPGSIDGVVVMVDRSRSAHVVRDCAARGVRRVWLFKGVGAPGAVSDEALIVCAQSGIEVIAGACPLMFLEPVPAFHKLHRAIRRAKGAVSREPVRIGARRASAKEG